MNSVVFLFLLLGGGFLLPYPPFSFLYKGINIIKPSFRRAEWEPFGLPGFPKGALPPFG
jgi:hypothetical protein